jgi:hypothetical protein
LENEKLNILEDLSKLGEREKIIVDNLQQKYGTGNINPVDGVITPL